MGLLEKVRAGERLGGGALRWLPAPPVPPAWRLSEDEREGIEILWPERYGCSYAQMWVAHLYHGLQRHVAVRRAAIPQFGGETGPVAFRVRVRGRWHDVAVSPNDSTALDYDFADRWAVLFKMQHRNDGYALPQVVPGGYTADSMWIHLMQRGLRRARDRQQFAHGVHARFGTRFGRDVRGPAIARLASQDGFPFTGGGKLIGYRDFLREVARAQVCVDLPGNGPLCFRLVNYLAVGACIVAFPHAARLPVPLEDRVHVAFTRPDLSDLVALCRHYVERPAEREAMRVAAQRYYDDYLHPSNLAAYYLRTLVDRLG